MAFRILIVDDSTTIRGIIQRILNIARVPVAAVYQAENGQAALDLLRAHAIDVVFADIHMPVMDGITMIDHMRGDPNLAGIAVIVISTEGSLARIRELRDKGIRGYLRKPFTPEKVRDTLKGVMGDWTDEAEQRSA